MYSCCCGPGISLLLLLLVPVLGAFVDSSSVARVQSRSGQVWMGLVAVWLCDERCYLHCFSEVKIFESDWLGAVAVAVFDPAPFSACVKLCASWLGG